MFYAREVADEMIRSLRDVIPKIALRDSALADQLRRSAVSVVLNVREGSRRMGKDRAYHYGVAAGSADEADGALTTAVGLGFVDEAVAAAPKALLDRELGLLWGLTHKRR